MATKKKKARKRKNPRKSIRRLKKTLRRMGRTRTQRTAVVRKVKSLARTNPAPRKAKTGRWYKGPRGVKVRVRRVKGRLIVDVKK